MSLHRYDNSALADLGIVILGTMAIILISIAWSGAANNVPLSPRFEVHDTTDKTDEEFRNIIDNVQPKIVPVFFATPTARLVAGQLFVISSGITSFCVAVTTREIWCEELGRQ